jgi:hypothetical protein
MEPNRGTERERRYEDAINSIRHWEIGDVSLSARVAQSDVYVSEIQI